MCIIYFNITLHPVQSGFTDLYLVFKDINSLHFSWNISFSMLSPWSNEWIVGKHIDTQFFRIGTKSSKNINGKQLVIQFTIVENFKVFNNGDSSIEIFPGQNPRKSIDIIEVFNATSDSRERHF